MFDMIAGSETGAIIAASLAVKNKDPKIDRKNAHWADKSLKFFMDYSDELYRDAFMSGTVRFFFTIFFTVLGGYLGFKLIDYFTTI